MIISQLGVIPIVIISLATIKIMFEILQIWLLPLQKGGKGNNTNIIKGIFKKQLFGHRVNCDHENLPDCGIKVQECTIT